MNRSADELSGSSRPQLGQYMLFGWREPDDLISNVALQAQVIFTTMVNISFLNTRHGSACKGRIAQNGQIKQ